MRTFGIESEYASNADMLIEALYQDELAPHDELHRYHCDCDGCEYDNSYPWRGQRDSTVNGEMISHIFTTDDWDSATYAIEALCAHARTVGASTSASTGLHVHVGKLSRGPTGATNPNAVAFAYMLTERYFTEIVAPGSSRSKRQMNTTVMQAYRNRAACWKDWDDFTDSCGDGVDALAQSVVDAITADRHVDLNLSNHLPTYEFRAFNGTLAGWRMELAARLSVAFVESADTIIALSLAKVDDVASMVLQGITSSFPTKRPLITMNKFVDVLSRSDPLLRPLIMRQADFMRRQYAVTIPKPAAHE